MILPLDLVLLLILIITATLALTTKDLLTAVALLSAYSLFTALLFAGLTAVDVALVEAALGAGLTGILFIVAILATTRRSDPRLEIRRRIVVAPLIVAFLGLMLFASTGLPDRGDPQAPNHLGIGAAFLSRSLDETNTPNVVTSLLADYRSLDTLGETLVILTASLSATLVLLRREGAPTPAMEATPRSGDAAGPGSVGTASDRAAEPHGDAPASDAPHNELPDSDPRHSDPPHSDPRHSDPPDSDTRAASPDPEDPGGPHPLDDEEGRT